ncbi:autotransporter-associated beta strand repeat-containing protein [Citromicrobium sp. JLT1363]|uniref:autotransporter-associated beta strand repeat-containing protein n=1 Tax=Citromicrobium sp. JLT1363 TaxID=517722 RepID=UPI000225E833|nr:autotransporter-associated beta strand repeat-containing protein [Citromicrobium sp. JLT1363]
MGLTVAQSGSNGNSADRKARALRRALLVGGASALALTIAAPAFAQTSGGDGGESSNGTAGGAGGVGPNGEAGTDGVSGTFDGTSGTFGSGGGGGAAGPTGGDGGDGGANNANPASRGGAGGATPGADGANGEYGPFEAAGGGGGGGAHGGVGNDATTYTLTATQTGGRGGDGGFASSYDGGGGGGGGGAGGYGHANYAADATLVVNSDLAGGDGGNGGFAFYGTGGAGGDGGIGAFANSSTVRVGSTGTVQGGTGGRAGDDIDFNYSQHGTGGAGVLFTGTGNLLVNSGSIAGGAGGGLSSAGTPGAGGVGVSGAGLTVINSGSITGGLSGPGSRAPRANAVTFGAGENVFEYQSGSSVTGNVVGDGDDLFRLGGNTDGTFDLALIGSTYQGFGSFEKTGNSTFTLGGTTTQITPWTISDGVLEILSAGALGADTGLLTFNNPDTALEFTAVLRSYDNLNTARDIRFLGNGAIDMSSGTSAFLSGTFTGGGRFIKTGRGRVVLSGDGSGRTGTTYLDQGILGVGRSNALGSGDLIVDTGTTLVLSNAVTIANNVLLSNDPSSSSSTATFQQSSGNATIAGVISGSSANISKTGSGNLTFSGANTYQGTTTVAEGTLTVASNGALGTADGGTIVQDGATLAFNAPVLNIADAISITGTGASGAGALRLQNGDTSLNGLVTLAGDSRVVVNEGGINFRGGVTGDYDLTLNGLNNLQRVVAFSGDLDIGDGDLIADNITVAFYAGNSFTGDVRINSSTLELAAGGASTIDDNARLTMTASGRFVRLTLYQDETIGSLAGTSGLVSAGNGNRVLTLGGDNTSTSFGGEFITGGGTLSVVKTGTGTMTLTRSYGFQNNPFLGGFTIAGGTLAISADRVLGADSAALTFGGAGATLRTLADITSTRNVALNQAGTIDTAAGTTATFGGVISGFNDLTKTGAGTLSLAGANTHNGRIYLTEGTLRIANNQALNLLGLDAFAGTTIDYADGITNARSINLDSGLVTFNQAGGSATQSGRITGDAAITKTGTGNLTLRSNTYRGTTRIAEGTLTITNDFSLGSLSVGTIVEDGATLAIDGSILFVGEDISIAGDGVSGNGALRNLFGATDINGLVTLTGASTIANSAGILDLNGGITGAHDLTTTGGGITVIASNLDIGDGTLTKNGTGILSLWANNSFTGDVIVNSGQLVVGRASNPGNAIDDAARLTINGAGIVSLDQDETIGALVGSGDVEARDALRTLTIAGSDSTTFSGRLTENTPSGGVLALTKRGSGNLTLSGNNSYSGVTTVAEGTLTITNGGALGSLSAGTVVEDGATLVLGGSGIVSVGEALTLTGTGVDGAGALVSSGPGVRTVTGAITLAGNTLVSTSRGANYLDLAGSITGVDTDFTFSSEGLSRISGQLSLGAGILTKTGPGGLRLDGANNDYGSLVITGGRVDVSQSTGLDRDARVTIGAAALLTIGQSNTIGSLSGSGSLQATADSTLTVGTDGTSTTYSGRMADTSNGNLALTKIGNGTLTLSGSNAYTGETTVQAGTLVVNGDQSATTGLTSVLGGAALGGRGTIGGDVRLADFASLNPGTSPGTLTINGNLSLSGGSYLNYEFGEAGVVGGPLNDLVVVGGDLTLDGTLNVTQTQGGTFGPGVYRVINYGGTLTDNGLTLGSVPGNNAFVQTSVANQVNLVNTTGLAFSFWDGSSGANNDAVDGGSGIWQNSAGNRNWTDAAGALNGTYDDGTFAIFQGAAGTVTIDNSLGAVTASGLQFATDGYVVDGDTLTLDGSPESIIRVGDGTAAGANITATIAADIAGTAQLVKTDLGTLVLSGDNTYTGGTRLDDGGLVLGGDNALGTGTLTTGAGTTVTMADGVTLANAITLDGDTAFGTEVLPLGAPGAATISGTISGTGALIRTDRSDLTLTGANTYSGGTTLRGLTTITNGSALGTGTITAAGGVLTIGADGIVLANDIGLQSGLNLSNTDKTVTLSGNISGSGNLGLTGTGTYILTGASTYTGGTLLVSSTARLANNAAFGTGDVSLGSDTTIDYADGVSIANRIETNNRFTLNQTGGVATHSGVIAGATSFTKTGSGTLVLSGANTFTRGVTLSEGTLTLGNGSALGTGALTAADGTTLRYDTDRQAVSNAIVLNGELGITAYGRALQDGVISGSGGLRINALTILTGANTFSGGTTIESYGVTVRNNAALGTGAVTMGDFTSIEYADGITLANALTLNGTALLGGDRDYSATQSGTVSGTGTLSLYGTGTLTLTGANTYSGGTEMTEGTLLVGNDSALGTGTLSAMGGTLGFAAADLTVANAIEMPFAFTVDTGTNSGTLSGVVSGNGNLTKTGTGTLTLRGANTFTGGTNVQAGTLYVNGDQSAATGLTSVADGATLGGTGIIGGDVTLADGASLNPGTSPGTLTINGNLALSGGSILNFEFGEAGVAGGALNDLVNVGGDLTLDGTLNVSPSAGGTFGAGVYRLFNYGGTLTDNGLTLGTTPTDRLFVQTSVANQINLINTTGVTFSFWDGAAGTNNGNVDGGDGIWQTGAGNTNWTGANGEFNGGYDDGTFAIFQGAAGTVTIDNSLGAVTASGLQFATGGYVIDGDTLTLDGGAQATIRVGDGSAVGETFTATIAADIAGTAQLVKTDLGTLVLSGDNTYTGGTSLEDGALVLGGDNALGTGTLTTGAGTTVTMADGVTLANAITLDGDTAFGTEVLPLGAPGAATISGTISGTGALIRTDRSDLTLTGANTYSGGTTLRGLTTITNGSALGTGTITAAGGVLTIGADGIVLANDIDLQGGLNVGSTDNTVTLSGTISGAGNLGLAGSGTFILTGTNTYAGGTALISGTVRLANDSALGTGRLSLGSGTTVDYAEGVSIANRIETNNRFTLNQTGGVATHSGVIAGATSFTKTGSGTLLLSGDNTFTRGVTLSEGALILANDSALGTGTLTALDGTGIGFVGDRTIGNAIALGGLVTFDTGTASVTQSGSISGGAEGALVKIGSGNLTLSGASSYSGTTTVAAGTLTVASSNALGSTAGGTIVRNGATLAIDTFVTSENISIVGGGVDGKGALVGSGVLNGTVTLADAAAIGGASGGGLTFTGAIQGNDTDLFFYGPGSTTISGGIATGSGDVIIDTNGGSVSFLSGNSFTGDLAMVSGALSINAGGASTIGDTARILATGGSITLAQSETVGSISGSGLTIAGIFRDQTLTTGGDDSSTTFSGTLTEALGGTLALTKVGAGTFALTGDNTYSGGTTLNGGALVLGSDSALGTGMLTATDGTAIGFIGDRTIGNAMALGGAFTLDTGANSITQNGVISGSGTLAKVGTGTLSLTAANTYSGTIDVQAGTLANSGAVAAVINRATFINTGTAGDVGNTGTLNNEGTLASLLNKGNATLADTSIVTGAIENDSTLALGGQAGSLLQIGGATTVATNASLSGDIALQGGTLTIGSDGQLTFASLGTAEGTILTLGEGASLIGTGNSMALGGTTNAADGVSLIDSGTIQNLATGTLAFAGAATIDTDTDASGDEAFVNAGTVRLAGDNTQVVSIGGNGGNDVSNLTNAQLLVDEGRLDVAGVLGNAGLVSLSENGILNVDTLVNASGGSIVSTGAIFASSGIANRAGATLSSTGTLGGFVVNEGAITARGLLNGQLSNEGAGLFTVTGDLASNGSDVANIGTAVLAVSGGDLTGVGTLVNASLGADGAGGNAGLRIAAGRTLAADLIGNSGEILIAGTLTGRVEQTAGLLTNNGTIAGDLVANGGAVSGSGAFDGDVMILADAIFAPGAMGTVATIDIAGMFGLGGTTSYDLGTADVIGGATNDLVLAGSAVIDGGTFDLNNAGAGTYRLINTGGEGSIAVGQYALLNAAEGSRIYTTGNGRYLNVQVGAISTQYWDGSANAGNGAVEGGTGVWTNALGRTNWTGATGALNNSWQGTINPPVTAVFAGTAGVVSVDTSAGYIGFGGMRFDSDGYVIAEAAGDDAPDLGANGTAANVFAGIASSADGIASTITVADAGSTARIEAGIAGVTAATGLIVDGAGTLELAGNNEGLTGTVAVLDGTLRAIGGSAISNASALVLRGDAAFEITDDEAIGSLDGGAATTVALGENMLIAGLNGDDTTFGGVISGAGSFVKTGAGTMTLTGANTYTGTTAVVEGALVLGASDVLSDETLVAVEEAILDLGDNSDTVGFFQLVEGTLAGTGTLTAAEYQLDTAQVTANLGTGMLFQTGGTSVMDGTSAADLVAINAGTLRLGASERLADTASVQVAEDATFDLTAATETIAALYGMGTVELGVGQLTVGGTGLDSGFEGLLSGSGTLSKAGSGVFTLLGDQAGWTGDFEVLGGTLRYFGNSGGGALISGGTLSGNSTFASALTMTGGTLSPGYEDAPVGMISAQTIDLLGGTALFDFRSPEFGGGADLLLATGAITIADTEVAIASGDARSTFPAVQRYVIVQGDSLTGTFANGDTFQQMEEAPKLFWRLRYDLVENGVALEVRRMFDFGANLGEGATPNQIAVATTLSSGQLDIGDTFADAILPLADLDEADQLRVFDSLGGESLTSATTGAFIEGQRFADLLTQRIYSKAVMKADTKAPAQARALAPVQQGTANALAAPDVASVSMWMQGFGGETQLDGDAVTRKLSHDASGFAGGLEARLGQFKAGVAGGYTDGSYDVRSLQASMQGETVHVGGYLGYEGKAAFAGLFGAYQNSDFDSTRLVTAANTRPLTAEAEIEMTGRTLGAFAGYRASLGGAVVLTPMVGLSNIRIERDGFDETGADPLNLRVSEETREVTYATAQLRLSAVTPVSGGTFEPYLAGGIERYGGDLGAVSEMRFAGAAGDMGAFRIIGAPLEETVGVLGAGFDVRPNERIEIGASAGTRIGERINQATVEMHARIRF